jgi:hypothetical protein
MPENLCLKCKHRPLNNPTEGCGYHYCEEPDRYHQKIEAKKELLEYLKQEHYLGASVIDPMLSQLKEAKP